MAINSVGYPGTVDAVEWAEVARLLGSVYAVAGTSDFRVERTVEGVRVLPGVAHGHGVTDVSTAPVNLPLTTTVGQSVAWMIAIRRTWQTTNATTVVAVELPGPPASIPMGSPRMTSPGEIDDQPLALVVSTAGQSNLAITDLRLIGAGSAQAANSMLALDLPQRAGHMLSVGRSTWVARTEGDGLSWSPMGGPLAVLEGSLAAGWAASGRSPALRILGGGGGEVMSATISDPGQPYRISAHAQGEWGCEDPLRWDWVIFAGGDEIGRHVDYTRSGMQFRTVTAPLTPKAYRGPLRVSVQAQGWEGGWAARTDYNNRLVVEVWPA